MTFCFPQSQQDCLCNHGAASRRMAPCPCSAIVQPFFAWGVANAARGSDPELCGDGVSAGSVRFEAPAKKDQETRERD